MFLNGITALIFYIYTYIFQRKKKIGWLKQHLNVIINRAIASKASLKVGKQ
jgi:hypothetical protein